VKSSAGGGIAPPGTLGYLWLQLDQNIYKPIPTRTTQTPHISMT
jgi:hypothetical protein